jgi:hypothetical protein
MPPILGTPGLLEDAIAQGQQPQQLAQMSSFFQPGQAQQFETAANASLARGDLPAINPWSGRQWGEESAIYQNQDVAALHARDATRAKMLEVIGRLDPDIQGATMRQWGFAPEQEVGSTNYNGMSPTQALFGGGQGGMGEIGSKLRQELIKLKYAHELGADEREKADILRNIQAMTALSTAQSNATYKQAMEGARQTTNANQLLGLLDNFINQHQAASQPAPLGNPTNAAALAQAIEYIRSQIGQVGGGGMGAGAMQGGATMTGRAAGNPAAMDLGGMVDPNRTPTYSELNPPVEQQTPWWDRGMPSSRPTAEPTQDIMGQVNYYQKRLEAVKKYDPGNVAAQQQLQRAIQNLLMPQFIQGTQSPAAAGNEGITVKKK